MGQPAFKPINDTYDRATGDFVLQTVAERLRGTGMVTRLGGDECVIFAKSPQPSLPELLARAVQAVEAVEAPIA